jgi:hypothetical protein
MTNARGHGVVHRYYGNPLCDGHVASLNGICGGSYKLILNIILVHKRNLMRSMLQYKKCTPQSANQPYLKLCCVTFVQKHLGLISCLKPDLVA